MNCPICGSKKTEQFLHRKNVPAHQNTVMHSKADALGAVRGNLLLRVCTNCGFAFNSQFDNSLLSYERDYENAQGYSEYFSEYMQSTIKYLVEKRGVRGKKIIEIGCGNSVFLKTLCQLGGNQGIGFDLSYSGPDEDLNGQVKYRRQFYGPECADICADVIICRHVIEHIPDPLGLLKTIGQGQAGLSQVQVFFETPCLEWILENQAIWDFFYEHCSYFTKESLTAAFEHSGFFEVGSVHNVFQGQYLWLEAKAGIKQNYQEFKKSPWRVLALTRQFASEEGRLRGYWQKRLQELRSMGPVAVWGAGAKGATFVNLFDSHCELIDCVVDLNPAKQGGFIPGSGHQIIDYHDLSKRNVAGAILMNRNYKTENQLLLKKAGIKVDLIDNGNMERGVKLIVDAAAKTLIRETDGQLQRIDLYSNEAFELISQLWLKVGWNQKHIYTFSWMGRPIIQLPEDMLRIQEVIYHQKPDVIIETGVAHGGSLIYYASLCKLIGKGRVIGVDIEIRQHNRQAIESHQLFSLITLIEGSSIDPEIAKQVKYLIKPGESVLVILDSCHAKEHVLNELELYCNLVTPGSYLVATDGIMKDFYDLPRGNPEWTQDNPVNAVSEFITQHPEFSLEEPKWAFNESQLSKSVTHWPRAFLKRNK